MKFIKAIWRRYVRAMENFMFWIGFNTALIIWTIKEYMVGNIDMWYATMIGVGFILFIGIDQQLHHNKSKEEKE